MGGWIDTEDRLWVDVLPQKTEEGGAWPQKTEEGGAWPQKVDERNLCTSSGIWAIVWSQTLVRHQKGTFGVMP